MSLAFGFGKKISWWIRRCNFCKALETLTFSHWKIELLVWLLYFLFIFYLFIFLWQQEILHCAKVTRQTQSLILFFGFFAWIFSSKRLCQNLFFFFYWISHELFLASKYSSWGSSLANLLKYSSSICLLRISDETKSLISWSKTFWYFLV